MLTKNCKQCGAQFQITDNDLKFYDKMSPVFDDKKYAIPSPDQCPPCRMRQRMIFRNESSLHHRKCSKTGKNIIAMYDENVPFPVYCPEVWFGDSWDPHDYAQDFDFNRPFFEQVDELRDKVPHLSLVSSNNQNCDFCNIVGESKDCYLTFGSIECENCYYGTPFRCKRCCDSLLLRDSELCIQCTDSDKLYECIYCQNCSNSHGLKFCYGVHNSYDCFSCVNLNHGKYCILNKQYTKEEYEKILSGIDLTKDEVLKDVISKLENLKMELPHRCYIGTNNEDVSGNYIFNCKDCHDVYGVSECRDTNHSYQMLGVNDCMDSNSGEYGELVYEVVAFFSSVNRVAFSAFVWDSIDSVYYSAQCNKNVRDCFGCIGLKHAQYCIFNKQYTKTEYEKMVARIIEHMKETGEWGQFFPASVSIFAYNESAASDYYPLSKEEVLRQGFKWKEIEGAENKDAKDSLICEVTGKPFRIILQEKAMYEKFRLALPKRSPKQRHLDRIALRNPMVLWDRKCDKCGVLMRTSYSPDRHASRQEGPEKVYCEKCYLEVVY
ncbi:MAG: hypothetical protein AAB953_03425 [Patescibacteria group bacterium]